jgi:perosamine synthetase
LKDKIYWNEFSFWGREKEYVNSALDSTWISGGNFIEKFENELSKKLNLKNTFVVSNGTSALQLAFLTIDIKPGDEVIVPAFGFLAAANVLKQMNAKPVFVDVDEYTWCIDPKRIKERITNKTKAILTIHNYGVVNDIHELSTIARKNDLFLIEDCAESIFSKHKNIICGSYGDISTFSFHATKTISCGEGGMVSCKQSSLVDKLKLIRSHGLRRKTKHYWHEDYGNNFRMSNVLAAIGLGQLEKSNEIIKETIRVYKRYKLNLSDESSIKFQFGSDNPGTVIWATAIYLEPNRIKKSRDEVIELMAKKNIECRPGFYTPNQLDIYSGEMIENFNVANSLASNIIVLPSSPKLKNHQIDHISTVIKELIR